MRKLLIGLLLPALALTCFPLVPRERLLLSAARRITAVDEGPFSPTVWLSDRDVILMPYRQDQSRFEFVELDTVSGLRQPLPGLNRALHAELQPRLATSRTLGTPGGPAIPVVSRHIPPQCDLSPDHQWLLCLPPTLAAGYSATSLDGSKQLRWKGLTAVRTFVPLYNCPVWLRDSHRWITDDLTLVHTSYGVQVTLRDSREPKESYSLPFDLALRKMKRIGCTLDDRIVFVDMGVADFTPHFVTSVDMADCSLTPAAARPNRYAVRLPVPAQLRLVSVSRQGNRLAWLLQYDKGSTAETILHRILPAVIVHPHPTLGLFVSSVDGTGMVEIGHKAVVPAKPFDPEIANVQWLPGDRRVSFICNDALYTVAVP